MLYYVEQKIMDGPSVWGHTLVAKEIIVPKLVDKGKGKWRGKRSGGRRKKRQHETETINLSLSEDMKTREHINRKLNAKYTGISEPSRL